MRIFHIILPPHPDTDVIKLVDGGDWQVTELKKTEIDHFSLARWSYLFLQETRLRLSGIQIKTSISHQKMKVKEDPVSQRDGHFAHWWAKI